MLNEFMAIAQSATSIASQSRRKSLTLWSVFRAYAARQELDGRAAHGKGKAPPATSVRPYQRTVPAAWSPEQGSNSRA